MIDENAEIYHLRIQRVRCRACNASHCQLYDFLVPYRRLSLRALEEAARAYIQSPNTYLDAGTHAVDGPSAVFNAVKRVLQNLPSTWQKLMRILIAAGFEVAMLAKEVLSPNSNKCKTTNKQKLLDWAAAALELIPDAFEFCSRHGFFLFASGRGCTLLRTHTAECKLF
jgi:Domain of unknown function (DUF6431)